jgi:decaprenylphospho-beta-D-ribofuranose 2-oxidase
MAPDSTLSGWGGTAPSACRLLPAPPAEQIPGLLAEAGERGVLARGLGRAYGDAAQNAGGWVIDATSLDPPVVIGAQGLARLGGGTSLDRVMREALPRGWWVPVTPGTRQVTVGGAIAADIHGKNHHIDGSFAGHVRHLTLASPTGLHQLGPEDPLFWATAGGMGLTGVVVEAELQLVAVPTSRMLVDTDRTTDLDHTLSLMAEVDTANRYSVCWIDCVTPGRHLGRSVLTRGDHAPSEALAGADREQPLGFSPRAPIPAPSWAPSGLLNPMSIRLFNEAWYRSAPRRRRAELQTIAQYFHPLDGVKGWNRMYGSRGFLQYQMLVPFGAEDVLQRTIEELARRHCPSFLGVLKRFGDADPAPLSFPGPGWTLALDMPASVPGLGALLDEIDGWVAGAGGRVYLAKDSRLRPEVFSQMYPLLEPWRRVRERADPDHRLNSDLNRRLGLTGPRPQRAKV